MRRPPRRRSRRRSGAPRAAPRPGRGSRGASTVRSAASAGITGDQKPASRGKGWSSTSGVAAGIVVDATVSAVSTEHTPSRPVRSGVARPASGGLLPTSAVAREGDTLVVALCVEVHAEGAVLPLLVLSRRPRPAGLGSGPGPERARRRRADVRGRQPRPAGRASARSRPPSGSSPRRPPDARRLLLEVSGLVRTAVARRRRASSARSPAPPGASTSTCVPPRTAAEVPEEPATPAAPGRPARVPARTFGGFRDLVPIGQARDGRRRGGLPLGAGALRRPRRAERRRPSPRTPCGWRRSPPASAASRCGTTAAAGTTSSPIHGAARPGWSETSLEVAPAIDPAARALGVRLADLPGHAAPPAAQRRSGRALHLRGRRPARRREPAPVDGPAWVVLPDLRRGRERRRHARARPARALDEAGDRRARARRRRRLARRHRPTSRRRVAARDAARGRAAPRRPRRASARPTGRASGARSTRAPASWSRWTATSPTTPRRCRR